MDYNLTYNESWYHITKTNGMHEPHIHPSCSWCGVYYVQSGMNDSGDTVFENPAKSTYVDRGNLYLNNMSTLRVKPRDGLLVLFPSYLSTLSSVIYRNEDRIVIAFNSSVRHYKRGKVMEKNYQHCLEMILHHEGGYVNHPEDPGHLT